VRRLLPFPTITVHSETESPPRRYRRTGVREVTKNHASIDLRAFVFAGLKVGDTVSGVETLQAKKDGTQFLLDSQQYKLVVPDGALFIAR
jgi:hypothetical protein